MSFGRDTTDEMIYRCIKEQCNPMVANDGPSLLGSSLLKFVKGKIKITIFL